MVSPFSNKKVRWGPTWMRRRALTAIIRGRSLPPRSWWVARAQQGAPLDPHRLRAQMAGRVIGDLGPGRALEVGREARLLADRPQELAGILDGGGQDPGPIPIQRRQQRQAL